MINIKIMQPIAVIKTEKGIVQSVRVAIFDVDVKDQTYTVLKPVDMGYPVLYTNIENVEILNWNSVNVIEISCTGDTEQYDLMSRILTVSQLTTILSVRGQQGITVVYTDGQVDGQYIFQMLGSVRANGGRYFFSDDMRFISYTGAIYTREQLIKQLPQGISNIFEKGILSAIKAYKYRHTLEDVEVQSQFVRVGVGNVCRDVHGRIALQYLKREPSKAMKEREEHLLASSELLSAHNSGLSFERRQGVRDAALILMITQTPAPRYIVPDGVDSLIWNNEDEDTPHPCGVILRGEIQALYTSTRLIPEFIGIQQKQLSEWKIEGDCCAGHMPVPRVLAADMYKQQYTVAKLTVRHPHYAECTINLQNVIRDCASLQIELGRVWTPLLLLPAAYRSTLNFIIDRPEATTRVLPMLHGTRILPNAKMALKMRYVAALPCGDAKARTVTLDMSAAPPYNLVDITVAPLIQNGCITDGSLQKAKLLYPPRKEWDVDYSLITTHYTTEYVKLPETMQVFDYILNSPMRQDSTQQGAYQASDVPLFKAGFTKIQGAINELRIYLLTAHDYPSKAKKHIYLHDEVQNIAFYTSGHSIREEDITGKAVLKGVWNATAELNLKKLLDTMLQNVIIHVRADKKKPMIKVYSQNKDHFIGAAAVIYRRKGTAYSIYDDDAYACLEREQMTSCDKPLISFVPAAHGIGLAVSYAQKYIQDTYVVSDL